MVETVPLDLVPADHQVHVALFRNVQNSAFLHTQLLARNTDFEYAFIDASVVVSRAQILAAAFKALSAKLSDTLKTPNVHSELVTSLSPSKNISEAYRRFGIGPGTKDLVAVKIAFPTANAPALTAEQVQAHLKGNVEGTEQDFSDSNIAEITDFAKLKKYYKLNGLPWLDKIKNESEKRQQMDGLVLSAMALRGA